MKRTQSDKVLRDKTFEIASDPKYDRNQRELSSMVYNFFWYKSLMEVLSTLNQIINSPMNFISKPLKNSRK